jgi:hypothetical protein
MYKKTFYLSVAFCLALIVGCAGMKAERKVVDNVFYSSAKPKMSVKVNPDYKYIGKYEKKGGSKYEGSIQGGNYKDTAYMFGVTDERTNLLEKCIAIRVLTITDMDSYWLPDLMTHLKNQLDSGFVTLKGERYQYAVAAAHLGKEWENFISDKGCQPSNCYVGKFLGRRVGTKNKTKIYLMYLEDIVYCKDTKYHKRKDWKREMLSSDQIGFIKKVSENADKNIQILD